MIPEEKRQLLALFDHEHKWCRDAEAQDANGDAVRYDEAAAVAWDITGALCRLFGWRRACQLFTQLDRHINGERAEARGPSRHSEIASMVALQAFNDRLDTTFEMICGQLEGMPVWHGAPHSAEQTRSD
ncbi:MAG: hypothetical protein JXQ75_00810 [Phycisphaerae bacterium]|nr:hypothetical protein [Phycisphaerae bacterium]